MGMLFPRVVPKSYDLTNVLTQPFPPDDDLVVVLVASGLNSQSDEEDSYVSQAGLKSDHGVSWEEAYSMSMLHLEQADAAFQVGTRDDGAAQFVLLTGQRHVAARILNPKSLRKMRADLGGVDYLLAIPTLDRLVAMRLDDVDMIRDLAAEEWKAHSTDPSPVSKHLYRIVGVNAEIVRERALDSVAQTGWN